jgi:hypothetical protein
MPLRTALSAAGGMFAGTEIAWIRSVTDPQWFDPNQENIDL